MTAITTQRVRAATIVVLCLVSTTLFATDQQQGPRASNLAALDPFIGRWQGTTSGQPGDGTVDREYTRILNQRFVHLRNRATYPPQERNPKGEEHEDIGIFSADASQKRVVFRQFHVEGFVNHYVEDATSTDRTLVFVTDSIENVPKGWSARETYRLIGPDEFEEVFELAPPGKPFEVYSHAKLKRAR